jgi:hypothetical protein
MTWQRLRTVVELNVDSVKKANPKTLGPIDTRPHYVRLSLSVSLPACYYNRIWYSTRWNSFAIST